MSHDFIVRSLFVYKHNMGIPRKGHNDEGRLIYDRTVIDSSVRPVVVELKGAAKLLTSTGLSTMHAVRRIASFFISYFLFYID